MKRKIIILVLGIYGSGPFTLAQNVAPATEEIIKQTDFSVPSSPAFLLLDANPSQVNRPGFVKDFKFDWVFQGQGLNPNIAIEAQPIWLFFYDNVSLSEYQKQNFILRALSTTTVSLGTVDRDSVQSLAYSLKITLFNSADPMMDNDFINRYAPTTDGMNEHQRIAEIDFQLARDTSLTPGQFAQLTQERDSLRRVLNEMDSLENLNRKQVWIDYQNQHWNASALDVGFGQVFDYSADRLDQLGLARKGTGVWVNGALGFGRQKNKWLLGGLFKLINYDDTEYTYGLNLRYGSARLNIFAESVWLQTDENTITTFAYGGDYRLNPKVFLQVAIRTEYNEDFNLQKLLPRVNVKWAMNR